MIISHSKKFIFIKTRKTAGTSIEVYLSKFCDKDDIITPVGIESETSQHNPRNYKGFFNPIPEFLYYIKNSDNFIDLLIGFNKTIKDFLLRKKFYNHIPASIIKLRMSKNIFNDYFKFCVERNPWDKTLSHFNRRKKRGLIKNFEEYISKKDFCVNYPIYTDIKSGEIQVNKIIKYENLIKELEKIFDKIDIPFKGQLNVRAKGHFRKDRRPYQIIFKEKYPMYIEKIEEIFQKEINMQGYKF